MRLLNDIEKSYTTLRRHGVSKLMGDVMLSLRVRAQAPYERGFDRSNRIQTGGITELDGLTIRSPNKALGSEYVPSPGRLTERTFSKLHADLSEFTFVDFGSGKGRIVLRAALRNFKRVIGIEFAEELHAIARENLSRFSTANPGHAPVDLILEDATHFAIPDGNCVFFLYNPFRRPVMTKVLSNIETAYRAVPRKIFLRHLALKDESGNDADANRELLDVQPFLNRLETRFGFDDLWLEFQFGSFRMDIYESPGPA